MFKIEKEIDNLIEMSNIRQARSNLPVNIWLDDLGINRKTRHNFARLKVQNDYLERSSNDLFSVSIDKDNPKVLAGKVKIKERDLNKVFEWIKLNYDLLMEHWNGEIDSYEFVDKMRKLN